MTAIFSADARRVHFNRVVGRHHTHIVSILRSIDADHRQRGFSGVGGHALLKDVFSASRVVAEEMMKFDERHAEYAKGRLIVDGKWLGTNPFSESNETHLTEWLLKDADRMPAYVSQNTKTLLSQGGRTWPDRAKLATEAIVYDVRRFYGENRAFFNLECEKKQSSVSSEKSVRRRTVPRTTEARDKWLYQQSCKLVPYDTIAAKLKLKKSWDLIRSKQGIRAAAIRYAERHGLPAIPQRQE